MSIAKYYVPKILQNFLFILIYKHVHDIYIYIYMYIYLSIYLYIYIYIYIYIYKIKAKNELKTSFKIFQCNFLQKIHLNKIENEKEMIVEIIR